MFDSFEKLDIDTQQLITSTISEMNENHIKALRDPGRHQSVSVNHYLSMWDLISCHFSFLKLRMDYKRSHLGNLVLKRIDDLAWQQQVGELGDVFISSMKPSPQIENKKEIKMPRIENWFEYLTDQAKSQEEEIRSTFDEKMQSILKREEERKASYVFSCRRFGDFLTLEISRGDEKIAQSINLGKVTSIRFVHGKAAGYDGAVSFRIRLVSKGSEGLSVLNNWCSDIPFTLREPPEGYEYKMTPSFEVSIENPCLWEQYDPPGRRPPIYHESNRQLAFLINGSPIGSEDDMIYFSTLDLALFVPFGLGQQVHDLILAEIERGTKSTPIIVKVDGNSHD